MYLKSIELALRLPEIQIHGNMTGLSGAVPNEWKSMTPSAKDAERDDKVRAR
jgi:hypothetical protein